MHLLDMGRSFCTTNMSQRDRAIKLINFAPKPMTRCTEVWGFSEVNYRRMFILFRVYINWCKLKAWENFSDWLRWQKRAEGEIQTWIWPTKSSTLKQRVDIFLCIKDSLRYCMWAWFYTTFNTKYFRYELDLPMRIENQFKQAIFSLPQTSSQLSREIFFSF